MFLTDRRYFFNRIECAQNGRSSGDANEEDRDAGSLALTDLRFDFSNQHSTSEEWPKVNVFDSFSSLLVIRIDFKNVIRSDS